MKTTDLLLLGGVAVAGLLVYNSWKKKQVMASDKVTATIPELPKRQAIFKPTEERQEPIFTDSGVVVSNQLVPQFSVPVEMENFA
jgi:hypothetical protein